MFLSVSDTDKSLDASKSPDTGLETLTGLIHRIAGNDRDALARLYEQTNRDVYSFALSVLKDPHEAQDVMQDCYLQIYSAADRYADKGKPMAWILTITRNLCLKRLRANAKHVFVPEEEWNRFAQEDSTDSVENRMVLTQCMQLLDDTERQIVVLHAVSAWKHREIAALLKIPLPTVLSKYNRAIKKLQKALGKKFET